MTLGNKLSSCSSSVVVVVLAFGMSGSNAARAEQIGWTDASYVVDSPHSLPNHYERVIPIEAPPGTRKMRVEFAEIRMESGYDFITIRDQYGNDVETITGVHEDYVSLPVHGAYADVVVTTDGSVKSWGFRLRGVQYRGCAIEAEPNPSLTAAASCEAVRERIERAAIEEVRQRFSGGSFYWPVLKTAVAGAREAFSQTNVRTAGIDEGDVAKTDGRYVYALAGRQLRMFTTDLGQRALLRYAVDIEGAPHDLLLAGDRVIVLSGMRSARGASGADGGPLDGLRSFVPSWWTPAARTKVTILDSTSGAPAVVDEVILEGQYVTSRLVGTSLRLTVRRAIQWPDVAWQPSDVEWGTREYEQRLDELELDALDAVKARALGDWLPSLDAGRCGAYSLGDMDDAHTATEVVRIDVGAGVDEVRKPVVDAAVLSQSDIIYQSPSSLYLAGQVTDECVGDPLAGTHSYIHAFDIREQDRAAYLASGLVAGAIPSDYAVDESEDGYLRVATTDVSWREDDATRGIDNRVRVLGIDDGALVQVGVTESLEPGETMRSVRFIGDRGFVVTFRQVDPLIALDLAEPSYPQVLGELTVPGFSTYLHPVGDGRLFGLGPDFDDTGRERNGVALTLYDVSGPAPEPVDRLLIGSRSAYTPALSEHRAFTFYQPEGSPHPLLGVPFTDWDIDADGRWHPSSFLSVVSIEDDGLVERGRVDVTGLVDRADQFAWWSRPAVRRGLFVEDRVYAVSDYGVRAGRILAPDDTVAEVAAEPKQDVIDGVLRMEVAAADWPDAPIFDASLPGTVVPIHVDADIQVEKVAVRVDIEHSAPGDLLILLIRDGQVRVLRAWQDSVETELVETYEPDMRGVGARGDWLLWVVDTVPFDVGRVRSVRLDVTGPLQPK